MITLPQAPIIGLLSILIYIMCDESQTNYTVYHNKIRYIFNIYPMSLCFSLTKFLFHFLKTVRKVSVKPILTPVQFKHLIQQCDFDFKSYLKVAFIFAYILLLRILNLASSSRPLFDSMRHNTVVILLRWTKTFLRLWSISFKYVIRHFTHHNSISTHSKKFVYCSFISSWYIIPCIQAFWGFSDIRVRHPI
jgi:hypothetical protein